MSRLVSYAVLLCLTGTTAAMSDTTPIISPKNPDGRPSFDVLAASASVNADTVTFAMRLAATAGAETPDPNGALAGADVWSYVWPTSVDPASVGFEAGTGLLALAATSHPDFDDTPAVDESGDGQADNDGALWHSHWVVLVPNDQCGADALSVRDIPAGQNPKLPATWPGLPLFIDSPSNAVTLAQDEISITIALPGAAGTNFDGVTAALRVNVDMHTPLLCVTDVFDIASGDLSLPGKID